MWRDRIKIALVLCGCALCLALSNPFAARGQQKNKAAAPAPASAPNQAAQPAAPKDYEHFTHQSHLGTVNVPGTNHARILKCDSCHDQRDLQKSIVETTTRNKQLLLKFPGHKACVECHIPQFTGQPMQTCTICHNTRQGLTARPPQRDFPARYDFNAFFDAKQHELHVGYNLPNGQKTACNFCHKADAAKPAPLTIAGHPECFVCHAPNSADQKASQKSDCKVCHTEQTNNIQLYAAKYISRAYGARFTHQQHVGYTNGSCSECHTINAGYNQAAPISLKVKEHLTPNERSGRGCFSCHDGGVHLGRKVFSGEPGSEGGGSCSRCHTRDDFKVLPSSG